MSTCQHGYSGFCWDCLKGSSAPMVMNATCPSCGNWSCTCPPKDAFTKMQDEMAEMYTKLSKSRQLTLYQLGYAHGHRVGNIEYEIAKAWKDEQKK